MGIEYSSLLGVKVIETRQLNLESVIRTFFYHDHKKRQCLFVFNGAGKMLKPTLAEFETITAQGVVLVDFDVPWCASCRIQEKIIHSIAHHFFGRASVVSVDVDEIQKIAIDLDIRNVPTLVLFKEGKEVRRFIGLHSEEILTKALENVLR